MEGLTARPAANQVLTECSGSGVRGAAVLGAATEYLVTVACERDLELCGAALDAIPVLAIPRRSAIEFAYDTPLSAPRLLIDPADRFVEMPPVHADDVVVFGMVEARPAVKAQRVVVDPQHSLTLDDIDSTISASELVIVANRREAYKLTGERNLQSAALSILDHTGAIARSYQVRRAWSTRLRLGRHDTGCAGLCDRGGRPDRVWRRVHSSPRSSLSGVWRPCRIRSCRVEANRRIRLEVATGSLLNWAIWQPVSQSRRCDLFKSLPWCT